MKRFISILMILLVVASFLGCNNKEHDMLNSYFAMAYLGINSLNPVQSQSNIENSVICLLEPQLIRLYDGDIVYDSAESYTISDDCLTYTFTLRDGLKWSDESDLTAYDYEYGVYCLLAPEMGSPRGNGWKMIKNAEMFLNGECQWSDVGIKAEDNKTVVFTLERPMSDFDRTIAVKHIYPVKKDFLDKVGVDKLGSTPEALLYAGPYVLVSREGSNLILKKNKTYWNADNSFPTEELRFYKVEDGNTQIAMFDNKEIDAIQNLASQYNEYLKDYLYTASGGGVEFLWINQNGNSEKSAELLKNLNFRKALTYGMNRSDVTMASNSANLPVNYIIDPSFNAFNGNRFIDEYPADTVPIEGDSEKAREYLENALDELGYEDVSQLPHFDLVAFPGEDYKRECEALIDQWKNNLGITSVSFQQYDVGVAIDTFYSMSYDFFVISWESEVRPTDIMEALVTGGEGNAGIWSNEEYDRLVAQAVNEINDSEKERLIQRAEQVFLDDYGMIPIYILNAVSAVQPYVSGYRTGSIDGYEFDNLVVERS